MVAASSRAIGSWRPKSPVDRESGRSRSPTYRATRGVPWRLPIGPRLFHRGTIRAHRPTDPGAMITPDIARAPAARAALLLLLTATGACATAGSATGGRSSGFDFARLADSIISTAPLDRV